MSKTQVVGDMSKWVGMMKDFWRQVGDGSLTEKNFQAYLEHRNPFAITDIRQEWQEFYRKYFRTSVDFSDVVIPDDPGGFDRVIFIPEGLTIKVVVKAYAKKSIAVDIASNMDEQLKGADHNYAIRLRDRQEADEELKNYSFDRLKADGVNSITLLERLVFGLKYWSETEGDHLDVNNWNLCAGSQLAHGHVPSVHFHADYRKVLVRWSHPGSACVHLRSRQAVS